MTFFSLLIIPLPFIIVYQLTLPLYLFLPAMSRAVFDHLFPAEFFQSLTEKIWKKELFKKGKNNSLF